MAQADSEELAQWIGRDLSGLSTMMMRLNRRISISFGLKPPDGAQPGGRKLQCHRRRGLLLLCRRLRMTFTAMSSKSSTWSTAMSFHCRAHRH